MEVKVSMSYLDDEKYSVKNVSGNELVVDMYARDKNCLLYTSPSPRD